MPFPRNAVHINAFTDQHTAVPSQRCALHFRAAALLFIASRFLCMAIHFKSQLSRFCAVLNFSLPMLRFSSGNYAGARQFDAYPLPISAKLGYAAARLICSCLFLNSTMPFPRDALLLQSIRCHCLSVLNWALPLLFKSCPRISFASQCWAGHGHAIPFQFLAIPFLRYASPMLSSA